MTEGTRRDEKPILLTGGTGTLGRLVLTRLLRAGNRARILSRNDHENEEAFEYARGDLATGHGVGNAIAGCEIVIHCAGSAKGDDQKAKNLVKAARLEGVRHIVFISVVGADKVPISSAIDRAMFGYYGAKYRAEELIAESGIPWTTLRATQFHDLILTTVRGLARLPIVPVPKGVRFQPIDAAEVADRMVELAAGPPAGLVPAFGGPRICQMTDLLRSYLDAVGKRRPIMQLGMPGGAARAIRDGANLTPSRSVGVGTWEEFLVAEVGDPSTLRSVTS
jgi:uncharacterized protein YbjT (DUF2867 family)